MLMNLKQLKANKHKWPAKFATTIWWLWQWRNIWCFENIDFEPRRLCEFILECSREIAKAMQILPQGLNCFQESRSGLDGRLPLMDGLNLMLMVLHVVVQGKQEEVVYWETKLASGFMDAWLALASSHLLRWSYLLFFKAFGSYGCVELRSS